MPDNKKYYYLKLKDNFFDSEELIILQNMQDGYLYSILYLKLLCMGDYYKRGYRSIWIKWLIPYSEYISATLRINKEVANGFLNNDVISGLIKYNGSELIIRDLNVDLERNRSSKEYKEWRNRVFERDDYKCQKCGTRGVVLNAHHTREWALYPHLRYDLNNGVTLCIDCHKKCHKKRGRK